jgi:FtsZ-interacting cell division protein YlmF
MLAKIQSLVKAPKGQLNKFGNYKYRSCEDIVEAVKLVINPLGYYLTLTDEITLIGARVYVKATATLSNGEQTYTATAYAREEETKKGMDSAQVTGAASSYARKYALNGLFAIDDTKDADATNTHDKTTPTIEEKEMLERLVYSSNLEEYEVDKAIIAIRECRDYETYQKIQHRLENRQITIDQIPNPSQKDITKHLKKPANPFEPFVI